MCSFAHCCSIVAVHCCAIMATDALSNTAPTYCYLATDELSDNLPYAAPTTSYLAANQLSNALPNLKPEDGCCCFAQHNADPAPQCQSLGEPNCSAHTRYLQ